METEIIEFISEFTSVKTERVSPSTLINFDLGVDGDDGAELLEEYAKRFKVDLTPISEVYFGPEGVSISFVILWPYYMEDKVVRNIGVAIDADRWIWILVLATFVGGSVILWRCIKRVNTLTIMDALLASIIGLKKYK